MPSESATEPSQLPPRVVYGYLRVVRGDVDRAAALKAELRAFCRTHAYMLGTVFTDWGVDDTAIVRPGFSSLIDVCRLVGSYGVVVPTRSHLSTHDETLRLLQDQIQRTGAQLVATNELPIYTSPDVASSSDVSDSITSNEDGPA